MRETEVRAQIRSRGDCGQQGIACLLILGDRWTLLVVRDLLLGRTRFKDFTAPPFASGQIESWAAGVVHAICTVNFAFDKSQKPHVTSPLIAEHFGVSLNTASQKSKTLRDLFRMSHWGEEFSTAEMQKRNPRRMPGIW